MGAPGALQARILDLLLTLPSEEDRVQLLPDCFTPPAEEEEGEGSLQGEAEAWAAAVRVSGQEDGVGEGEGEETEELWCTPAQLLSELDAQLRQVTRGEGSNTPGPAQQQLRLGVVEGQMAGEELVEALHGLRLHVHAYFMQTMRQRE